MKCRGKIQKLATDPFEDHHGIFVGIGKHKTIVEER
jgi:hypothetical protein